LILLRFWNQNHASGSSNVICMPRRP
jgi:hypothetical protein